MNRRSGGKRRSGSVSPSDHTEPSLRLSSDTALRADAARNRAALLKSGQKCFARLGVDAQMDEIAEHAGLGIGTLYRHFPSKHDLIAALLTERLQHLVTLAKDSGKTSAFQRFASVLSELVEMQSRDRLISELGYCRDAELRLKMGPMLGTLRAAISRLMIDATASDELRANVSVDDVFRLVFNDNLSTAADSWQTYVEIVVDGLRQRRAPKAR